MGRLITLLLYQYILGVVLLDRTLVQAVNGQVTNVDIPSDIPKHNKIEHSQSTLQGKETVSDVQETETLITSSNHATSLPVDQSETSSIKEGTFSSTQVEPSFTDIQGTSQTEQYLTETVTQSASVIQSESLLQNTKDEAKTGTENGKSIKDSDPVKDSVEKSENLKADDISVKDSVKVIDTEVKDEENVKVTESVKVTDSVKVTEESSGKDTETSQNETQTKENVDQSEESVPTSEKQPSIQTSGGEPAVEQKVDGEPVVDQKVDGEPAVEQKVDEEPVVDQKIDGEPVVEQKVDGEPAGIQTEEVHEEGGLIFSEWKERVMSEAETEKHEGKEDSHNLQVPPVKQRKRKNYASHECGAKILTSNPEASSPKSVLNSNRDEYMNNPCKAKRWFVIELCEPIQAHLVAIASLELFSSQPKKFKLNLSDRYPTKDWKAVGEFTLKEERSIQNFTLKGVEDYFAKFVRVELTEHYGNEHFCPLTIFRMLGIAVGEYEDDANDMNADDDDDDDSDNGDTVEGEAETGSKNLFTSAKDTVINIVKSVLNVDSEEKQMVQNGTQLNATSSSDNATINGTMTTGQQSPLPCVPEISDGSKEMSCTEDRKAEDHAKHTLPDVPEPGKTDSKIVVKLEDDEQVETTPDNTPGQSIDFHIQDCSLTMSTLALSEKKYSVTQSKLCEFVYMIKKQSPVKQLSRGRSKKRTDDIREAKKDSNKDVTSDQNDNSKQVINSTIPVQVTHIEPDEVIVMVTDSMTESSASSGSSTVLSSKVPESKFEQETNVDQSKSDLSETASLSTSSQEIQPTTTAEEIVATATQVFSTTKTEEQVPLKQTGSMTASTIEQKEPTESEKIEPSPTVVETLGESTLGTSREATPVLPESWKPDTKDLMQEKTETGNQKTQDGTVTQTDIKDPDPSIVTAQSKESIMSTSLVNGESIQSTETMDTASVSASSVEETGGEDVETVVDDIQEQKANTTMIDDKVVVSNGGQQKRDNLNLVKLPAIPSGKRESAIMRLSNRIKVLEQNVSLSSRFLEELSRRYKKQSEDMMKMLNKTMATMHNMSVEADVKNKLHEDEMSTMERRLENLTEIVHKLTTSFDKLNRQVTDRQMIWTTIEIVIIAFIVLFLLLHRKRDSIPPEVRSLIESMPSKPSSLSSSYPQRRNSLSGPATPSKEKNFGKLHTGGGLQRFSSETALDSADTCSGIQNAANFPFKPGTDGVKKKKKKKNKNLENRLSSSSSGSSVLPVTNSTHPSSHDSTNTEFQSKDKNLLPLNIGNQSMKESSQLFAKNNQSKDPGMQASCNMSQTQSSCFGSLLSGWSNNSSSKPRSSSLGTDDNEAKELKIVNETFVKGVQKDGFGTKFGVKGLSKKPPVSGSSKVSPKLNMKVSKCSVNGSVNGNMDQSDYRLEDKKITKGHRRQKSLPKQHYSSIETVGSVRHESASNGLQGIKGTNQRFETAPLANKGHRKGEMKKSSSLPVSPDVNFEKPPVYSKSFANGYNECNEGINNTWQTGNGFSLAKSKSDHSCFDTFGQNIYNGDVIFNGACSSYGTVCNENNVSGVSGHSQINVLRENYDDRGKSGPFDVDNTSSVQNGKNGVWKNVFGYFR